MSLNVTNTNHILYTVSILLLSAMMKNQKKIIICTLFLIGLINGSASSQFVVSGSVVAIEVPGLQWQWEQRLDGVSVRCTCRGAGIVTTNSDGRFEISVASRSDTLIFQRVDFYTEKIALEDYHDATWISVWLLPNVNDTYYKALKRLYDLTDGDNWHNNSGWDTTIVPSSYEELLSAVGYGAHAFQNDYGRFAVSLFLPDNNLSGPIPPELGNLNFQGGGLILSGNNLSGSIPPELGNFNSWHGNFDLSHNNLSGPIPADLGNLKTQFKFDLSHNNLSGPIPPELGNLNFSWRYGWLDLSHNNLSGPVPPELGSLPLSDINISHNDLSGELPRSFLTNKIITSSEGGGPRFLFGNNSDLCAPSDLYFQQWLEKIRLAFHGYGIATESACGYSVESAYEGLKALYRSTNGDRWRNNFKWDTTGVPGHMGVFKEWAGLTVKHGRLIEINLQNNLLSGSIPPELGGMAGLERLLLSDNRLTGSLPSELANLNEIRVIDLDNNQIFGSIPPEIGTLSSLTHLILSNNQIFGAIPPELGGLTSIRTIDLTGNRLNGPIPPQLAHLSELRLLGLADNQLSGTISSDLGKLRSLEYLFLKKNQFSDPIPGSFLELPNLKEFYFQDNLSLCAPPDDSFQEWLKQIGDFDGPTCIPAFVQIDVVFKSLRELYRATNGDSWRNNSGWNTTATPSSMAEFNSWYGLTVRDDRLVEIDLNTNSLTGTLPIELGNLTALERLFLDRNQISGFIPEQLGDLSWLNWLGLSENRLTGSMPASLGKLTRLEHLYLNDNQLTGQISPMLGGLQVLRRLDVHDNQLSGEIPRNFLQLLWVSSFKFQNNSGLCSPSDVEFLQWLKNIETVEGNTCTPVSVEYHQSLPEQFIIHGNYPNPFQSSTRMRFDLPWPAHIGIEVFDVTGRQLLQQSPVNLPSGRDLEIQLNDLSFPAGIYLYRLTVDSQEEGLSLYYGTFVKTQ